MKALLIAMALVGSSAFAQGKTVTPVTVNGKQCYVISIATCHDGQGCSQMSHLSCPGDQDYPGGKKKN